MKLLISLPFQLFFACLFLLSPFVATAQQADAPATPAIAPPLLMQRANEIAALFREAPGGYEKVFAPSFLAQIQTAQLNAIFIDYFAKYGRCERIALVEAKSADAGRFEFFFAKGYSAPVAVQLDAAAPHLVAGFFIGNAARLAATREEVVTVFGALPGATSFMAARFDGARLEPLAVLDADQPLAIGSAFKLYLLCELVRSINAGEKKWADVVTLRPGAASLPSGILQDWPAGAPITLHTLAALMISRSDNTAADHMLLTLGRERVEGVLTMAGNMHAPRSRPFLSTLEMFKLKGEPTGKLAAQYSSLNEAGRRALLAGAITNVKRDDTKMWERPKAIDSIEWFASAADLCRAMDYLRTQTERDKTARDILAINPGLGQPPAKWNYVGYKGGSEPGVLNMTFLLRSPVGRWYTLSASWNNKDAPLDESKFFGLVQRALQLLK